MVTRMKVSKKKAEAKEKKPKGITIPAGTEQETGLTRAQTEKPRAKKPRAKKGQNPSEKLS
jgi:hypothetical protein